MERFPSDFVCNGKSEENVLHPLPKEFGMKDKIHPKVYKAKITCACGFQVEALSTKGENVHVEICSSCHPFFTGKQRFLDTAGRIDRFRKKYAKLNK